MKKIELHKISGMRFAISDISVIYQTNLWNVCHHPSGRIYNGFLLFDGGECDVIYGNEQIHIGAGALLYLPTGSTHKVIAPERSLHFYRINFTMTDLSDGEHIVFSDEPILISADTPRSIFSLSAEMCKNTLIENGIFKNLSAMSEILDYMRHVIKKNDSRKISDAIYYVENHYTEDIDVDYLASMSYLSRAQLFRLFKKEVGMSPIEYKNSLRLKKAEELLAFHDCTVSEISELVGFENCCYFSRAFKAHTGLSPLEYRKKNI